MKGRNRKKIALSLVGLLFLLCFGMAATGNEALAASAVVSLTTGEDEVLKGDVFSVMVTVESAEDIGNVEMFVVFDSSCVSFIDNGKYTIGGDGLVLISDWEESKSSTRKKYALEFKAKRAGSCKFSVGDQPAVFLADSEEQMSVSSVNMSVTVIKKNADTESEDMIQDIEVTENPVLDEREDAETVIESETIGDTQETEGQEELESNIMEKEPELGIHTTKVDDKTVITNYVKLTLKKVKDEASIPEGYMKTSIRLDREPVIAYIPEDDMGSEVYLLYGTDGEGVTGFYEYNRVLGTLKPYTKSQGSDTTDYGEEVVNANFQMMTVIFILIVVCAGLSAALALTIRKQKKRPYIARIEDDDFFEEFR